MTDKQKIRKLQTALADAIRRCEGCTGWGYDDDPVGHRENQRVIKRWKKALNDTLADSTEKEGT